MEEGAFESTNSLIVDQLGKKSQLHQDHPTTYESMELDKDSS